MNGAAAPQPRYARVVVEAAPPHLDRPLDYLVPHGEELALGQRVRVDFAGRRATGWVVGSGTGTGTDPARVRPLQAVQGRHRWFDEVDLRLYRWVADRYAASLADVLRHAMPERVAAVEAELDAWGDPPAWLPADRPPCPSRAWRPYRASRLLQAATAPAPAAFWWRPLPGDDVESMACDLAARTLAAGRAVLALVPDPASRLPAALLATAGDAGADLREQHGRRARYRSFLRSRSGHARLLVGERSAALCPLPRLGLVLVEDEASRAYKERRAPRYHARDVALARTRFAGAAAVLIGDLPSARVWRLLADGHVEQVGSDRALERKRAPLVEVVDRSRPRPLVGRGRLADRSARAITDTVRAGGAVAVVVPRRGEGTALACQHCGQRRACPTCAGWLRRVADAWSCAACAWSGQPFACPGCGRDRVAPLAAGAARYAADLARGHPGTHVAHMEGFDAPGPRGRPAIGVMTRGSVVARPSWLGADGADLAVLPEADAWLARPVLDAAEDALRLWFAVGRWARRVLLETREPTHPAVQALVRWDPSGFWEREAERRAELRFPPAAWLVRVSAAPALAADVAEELRARLPADSAVLGPDAEGHILLTCPDLHACLEPLAPLRHAWSRAGRGVRVDVDPVEL